MDPCTEMVCPPPSIGWSAIILWTITLYGVLGILSVFTVCVHWREPSRTGAKILRILFALDLATAAAAPVLLFVVLESGRAASLVMGAQLALASLCRIAGRRAISADLPPARLVR